MIDTIRQFFRFRPLRPLPAIPDGERVYAVGDVHGRLDLFEQLIAAIEQDDHDRGEHDTTIILLGDLIDRGPDSASVIAAARQLQQRRKVRIIAGNHEEAFLKSFEKVDRLRPFLRFGGENTVLSYVADEDAFRNADFEEALELMREAVPQADLDFIGGFENAIVIGDYLFVHAGIKPDVALEDQLSQDLRWIREPFLSHEGDHGHIIVHGHTITDEPEILPNRIGIDTGAYCNGRLTALGIQGTDRWLLEAHCSEGAISTYMRAA